MIYKILIDTANNIVLEIVSVGYPSNKILAELF